MNEAPWTVIVDGILLYVRLTPKGARDAIDGIETLSDGRVVLKTRVRELPEKGEANAGLIRLLAKTLGVPGSKITVESGHTSRLKRLKVEGDGSKLAAVIAAISSQ
jgi:hypothetical protein